MSVVISHRPATHSARGVGQMRPLSTISRDSPIKSHGQMDVDHVEHRDAQPMTVRCVWCPDFIVTGPAGVAREAAAAHLQHEHPELAPRARRRSKNSFADVWAERAREEAA